MNFRPLLLSISLSLIASISFGQAPDLGISSTFALFTASGAFNGDPATSVIGDIGTNVGAFTPPGFLVGQIHLADPVSAQAAADVAIAYGYLAGLTCGSVLTTPLGNSQTLAPNIYCIGTAAVLNADLILDGGGDPSAIFVFQINGALSTNPFSNILLINGANLCNVYWQINGALNVGGSTLFQGTVIAEGAINLANGATFNGRGLSTAGAISTSANVVTLDNACLCNLDVTCPNPSGGLFQCIGDIPAGDINNVTVNSSCGVPTVTISESSTGSGCTSSPYILTRTYTVTDEGGHSTDCVVTYTAIDQIAPTIISCPAAVVVSCANNVPAAAPTSVVSTDNCGGTVSIVLAGDVISNQICANQYTITRTYRATDACGNSVTCAQIITVNDITPPVITCPATVNVSCASNVPAANPASIITSDLCGGPVTVTLVGDVISNQICANQYTIARSYRATDACGNSATCAQIITVNDLTPPVITCPVNVVVSCASDVPPAAPASVTASDLCGGTTIVAFVGDVTTSGVCANRFSIARTYRATDLCGNSAICVQTITVNDITPPAITCPANVVVSCASAVPPAAPASIIASDLCGGAVTVAFVGDVTTPGICANRFSIARTYRATDLCGNSAVCIQTITVNDITPPVITCPATVNVNCTSDVPAANPAGILTSDLCGGPVSVILVGDVISNQICANQYTITRTYRATDACGNSAICAQIITVNDHIPPVFVNPPANTTVECFLIPAIPALPTATDNCTGTVTVVFLGEIQTPGICPIIYTLTRTWRANDVCGNSSTIAQVVTVTDTYAPQFVHIPADVVIECDLNTNGDAFEDWQDSLGGATIFDCSAITWTLAPSPFFIMPSTCGGTSQRFIRFTATDVCGNSAFKDAGFTIMDMTPPVFSVLPQDLLIECTEGGDQGEGVLPDWLNNFGYAEVSDKCGAVTTSVVLLSSKMDCGNTFSRIYEFRATDECGNTNFVTARFAIVDNTPPVIVSCPEGNVLLTCEFDIPAANPGAVIATDNCGGPVTLALQDVFSVGVGCVYWPLTKAYTYTATDACGNVSTCFQSFQVVDSIPPIYSGPDTITVICVADLPGIGEVAGILAPYFSDNCYDIICVNEGVTETGATWITFCIKAKDLCVNWTEKFKITFIATGGCKPICSAPQAAWGNTGSFINGMLSSDAIAQLIEKYGAVKAGKLGKTISVSSAACLQNMLPGNGSTVQFASGHHEFTAANECLPGSPLLNTDGTLKNKVAANALALQLNIWYNQEFNQRDLGVQPMSSLPPCLVDAVVISKLEENHSSVQGLLNLSNDYLAGVGFYPPNFGYPLSLSLENVNSYWQNCQLNDPCSISGTISVAGGLKTEQQDGLEAGTVQLESSNVNGPLPGKIQYSDNTGAFEFSDALPYAGNFTLTPSSEGLDYSNGVTTYDLVLISKHLLGWTPFNSPYKMIAADANRSGSITTLDIIELRKLILGISEVLPNNTPWRFVDQSFVFPNPNNPFSSAFPEQKTVTNSQGSQFAEDFVSVKIGDVNGSAKANQLMVAEARSESTLLFDLDDRQVQAGETFEVTLKATQTVQCYQFTLNTKGLEVLEVSGARMNADNFAVFAQDQVLTTSWNLPEGLNTAFASFTIKLRATQAGRLSEMLGLSSRFTKVEAFKALDDKTASRMDIALRFNGANIHGTGFELYQNEPNPFVDKTTIGFNLPTATQATLTIFDETGRMVFTQQGDFDKGYNAFVVNRALIQTNGILLYKLETDSDSATRKMVQGK